MKRDDSNSGIEFPNSWGSFFFIVVIGLFFYWLVRKIIAGIYTVVGLIQLGLKWFLLMIVSVLVLALVYSLLELIVMAIVRRRRRTKAMANCPLPTLRGLLGHPRSGVEAFLTQLFVQTYTDAFGFPPQRTMKEQELAAMRAELNPLRNGNNRAQFHQTIVAALYSELASGNDQLNKWVEQAAAATRRRRPFWLFMRVVRFLPFVSGWSPEQCWTQTSVEELKTSPSKFGTFAEEHAFPAMPFIEEVLAERVPLPARFRRKQEPLQAQPALQPAPKVQVKSDKPMPAPRLLPEASTDGDASTGAARSDTSSSGVAAERQRVERARLAALRQQAVEAVAFVGDQLTTDHAGWEKPSEMLKQHGEALELVREHHPEPAFVQQLGEMVEGCLSLLPAFEVTFAEEMERDPSDFSDWVIEVLEEATRAMPLEACTPAYLRRLACRKYVTTQPKSTSLRTEQAPTASSARGAEVVTAGEDDASLVDAMPPPTLRVPYSHAADGGLELGF